MDDDNNDYNNNYDNDNDTTDYFTPCACARGNKTVMLTTFCDQNGSLLAATPTILLVDMVSSFDAIREVQNHMKVRGHAATYDNRLHAVAIKP